MVNYSCGMLLEWRGMLSRVLYSVAAMVTPVMVLVIFREVFSSFVVVLFYGNVCRLCEEQCPLLVAPLYFSVRRNKFCGDFITSFWCALLTVSSRVRSDIIIRVSYNFTSLHPTTILSHMNLSLSPLKSHVFAKASMELLSWWEHLLNIVHLYITFVLAFKCQLIICLTVKLLWVLQ